MDEKNYLYENYCKLRDKHGQKDADVAKETGITKSTFSDWKSGRSTPKNDKLQKIARHFGVSLQHLVTGQEDESSEKTEILSNNIEIDEERKEILNNLIFSLKQGVESDEVSRDDLITITDMFMGFKAIRKKKAENQNEQ